jgi:hypothetical protein
MFVGSAPTDCKASAFPIIMPDEMSCMNILRQGIETTENLGRQVMDYECFDWKTRSTIQDRRKTTL